MILFLNLRTINLFQLSQWIEEFSNIQEKIPPISISNTSPNYHIFQKYNSLAKLTSLAFYKLYGLENLTSLNSAKYVVFFVTFYYSLYISILLKNNNYTSYV